MELRRVADALIRSHTSPVVHFLAPSNTLRRAAQGQIRCRVAGNRSMGRHFSCATRRSANWSPITTSTAPPPKEDSNSTSTTIPKADEPLESLVDSLGWASRPRPSLSSSKVRETREREFNGGSTASELLKAMNQNKDAPRYPGTGKSFSLNLSRMRLPGSQAPGPDPSQSVLEAANIKESPPRMPMKLGPSTGRTVVIGSGNVDIGRGFQLLNMSCSRNKVMRDLSRQRFHERGGLKRKRLARERWRRKFAQGFNAAVQRVRALQRQGW